MKAILCKELGPPESLVLEEVPSPKPGSKEVLIEIKACSVNYPDTLIIQGLYQFKPALPFSPGSDVSGIVKEVGEGVTHMKPGDEVFAVVPHGGFAEQVVAPAMMVFPKPPMMDFKLSASFTMTYGTSYHALKDKGRFKKSSKGTYRRKRRRRSVRSCRWPIYRSSFESDSLGRESIDRRISCRNF